MEFVGNEHIRDSVLRRRIVLQEGEVFSRRNLLRSMENVSKLKMIYRVRSSDVVIRLDRSEKFVDTLFCFRERRSGLSKTAS